MQFYQNDLTYPIIKKKLLIVEGIEMVVFLVPFLEIYEKDCQTLQMNGKDPLVEKITSITKISGFNNVSSIGIIIDADKNHIGAFQSICNPAMICVNNYFNCLNKREIKPKIMSKAKVNAFLFSRKSHI